MPRAIVFAMQARLDLQALFDYLLPLAGENTARSYVIAIFDYCLSFQEFPERGLKRDDLCDGLRVVGFRRRASIAFVVSDTDIVILRILVRGRNFDDPALFEG